MIATRHYPNAPITEAILDLRVSPRPDIKSEELTKVIAGEETAFAQAEPMHVITGQILLTDSATTSHPLNTQVGYVFRHKDGRYIHQARTDGFTISQLPKYSSWKDLEREGRRRWALYREVAQPIGISRAALRYVNRIDVAEPLTNIDDYLHTNPHIAAGLPQNIDGYFMQVSIPFPKIEGRAIITETIIPPATPGTVSIVLDIDVFKQFLTPVTDDEAWSTLEKIHNLKNEIFEACITDKARELFS
jgi:uncharacterized protein (TIGR04255 family)